MSACDTIRAELKAYVDRELSPLAHARVRRHLDLCANCRAESESLEHLSAELRALDNAMPRPELRARILAQLPQPPKTSTATPDRNSIWRKLPALALAAGAVTGLIILAETIRVGPPTAPLTPPVTPSRPDSRIAMGSPIPTPAPLPLSVSQRVKGKTTPDRPTALPKSAPMTPRTNQLFGVIVPITPNKPDADRSKIDARATGRSKTGNLLTSKSQPVELPGAPSSAFDSLASSKTQKSSKAQSRNESRPGMAAQIDTIQTPSTPLPAASAMSDSKELSSSVKPTETIALTVDNLDTKTTRIESAAKEAGASMERSPIEVDKDGVRSTSITLLIDSGRAAAMKAQIERLDVAGNRSDSIIGRVQASPNAPRNSANYTGEKKAENAPASTQNAPPAKASAVGRSSVPAAEVPRIGGESAVRKLPSHVTKADQRFWKQRGQKSQGDKEKPDSLSANAVGGAAAPPPAKPLRDALPSNRALVRSRTPVLKNKSAPAKVSQNQPSKMKDADSSNRISAGKLLESNRPMEITKITIRLHEAAPKR